MPDQDKSKRELLEELAETRRQVAALEGIDAERRQAKEALRLGEEHHRVLTETMLQGVVHHDAEGTIIAMNPAAERILGKTREQFLGSSSTREEHDTIREDGSLFPGVEHPAMVALRTGQPVAGVVMGVFNPKVDAFRWISIDAVPLFRRGENCPYQVYAVFEDITERKQSEEELRKNKAILRAAIECLPFDFFAIGSDGHFLLDNAVSRAKCGPLVGKTPEEVAPTEAVRALWLGNNQRAFAGETVKGEVAVALTGEERFVYNVITPIRDDTQFYGILGVNVDITERKRAEKALQKAHDELEQRVKERTAELAKANEDLDIFHKFAEDSDEGFGMSEFDGRIVYANQTLCRLFGEEKPEDVIGKHVSAYYPKEYLQRRKDELIPALLREGHLHIEQPLLPRHGETIQTLQSTFLIRDESGNPFRVAVVISDITERKRAQEALRQSEERFRVTFEEAPVGMVIGVGDGVITKANRALCGIMGCSEEELVGRHVRDFTHPDDRELSGPLVKKLMAGEIPSFTLEKRYLRKGGQPFWAQATTAMAHTPDGKIAFALGVLEDITDRKQAEEALRQSHDELAAIYDGMFDGLLMMDLETKQFTRANPSICQILGYSEKELLSMSLLDIHPPEEIPLVLQRVQARAEGRFRGHATVRLRRKDGSILWADVASNLLTHGGRPCITGFFRDITERKQGEEALRKEHRNLRHMLRSSDNERQLIAYEIHDGLAQQLAGALMQFQAHLHLKDTQAKQAANAYQAGLIMLQQSHFETRRLIAGVRPPILDESGVVEAVAHLVHEQGRDKGPQIEYRSRVDFGRLDPTLENAIYRIAQEGLTNACKHGKSEKVRVSLFQRADRVRIEIRDWGVGFDPRAVPKNHFGLEGIRQRARLLGGKCSISSKAGKGTRVMVELPVVLRDEDE